MLTLTRTHKAPAKAKRQLKQQLPKLEDISDLYRQERQFRRLLEWGSMGVSVLLFVLMFYLFDGLAWIRGIAS